MARDPYAGGYYGPGGGGYDDGSDDSDSSSSGSSSEPDGPGGGVDLGTGFDGGSDDDSGSSGGSSPGGSSPPPSDVGGPSSGDSDNDSDSSGSSSPGGSSPPPSDVGGPDDTDTTDSGGTSPNGSAGSGSPGGSDVRDDLVDDTLDDGGSSNGSTTEGPGGSSPPASDVGGPADDDPAGSPGGSSPPAEDVGGPSSTRPGDPRQNPENWGGTDSDGDGEVTWDETEVTGGGRVSGTGLEDVASDPQVREQAQQLEQRVIRETGAEDASDVEISRDGDRLVASLTYSGQENVASEQLGVGREDISVEDGRVVAETPEGQQAINDSFTPGGSTPPVGDIGGPSGVDPEGSPGGSTPPVQDIGGEQFDTADPATQNTTGSVTRDRGSGMERPLSPDVDFSFGFGGPEDEVEQAYDQYVATPTERFFDRARRGLFENQGWDERPADSFADRTARSFATTTATTVGELPGQVPETIEFAAGVGRDAIIIQRNPVGSEEREAAAERNVERGSRIAGAVSSRAREVRQNPSEIGGVYGQAGVALAAGGATSRVARTASGGRLSGSDLSGRAAARASQAGRRLASRTTDASTSAARSTARAAQARSPSVDVEFDAESSLIEYDGPAPSLPTRPSLPSRSTAGDVAQQARQLRARAGRELSERTTDARIEADLARQRAGEVAQSARERVPTRSDARDLAGEISRYRQRAAMDARDAAVDARFEADLARQRASEAVDSVRSRDLPSIGTPSRPFSETDLTTSARLQMAVAASSARRAVTDASIPRPSVTNPLGDVNVRQSAAVQADVLAGSARRTVASGVDSITNAPGRVRVAGSRARRRLSDIPTDARIEAAFARQRASDAASSVAERVTNPDVSLPSLRSDRSISDLTIRIEADGPEVRRARVPDTDPESELGPFASDELGDLDTSGASASTSDNPLSGSSDVDVDTGTGGSSGGPSPVAASRADSRTSPNPIAETSRRRDPPAVTNDVSRGAATGTFLGSTRSDAVGPSIDTDASPSVDAAVGTGVGEGVETSVGVGSGLGFGVGTGTGTGVGPDTRIDTGGRTDTRFDTGARTDTGLDTDLAVDSGTRTDTDLRFDLDDPPRRRDFEFDGSGGPDDVATDFGFGGAERRYQYETIGELF